MKFGILIDIFGLKDRLQVYVILQKGHIHFNFPSYLHFLFFLYHFPIKFVYHICCPLKIPSEHNLKR